MSVNVRVGALASLCALAVACAATATTAPPAPAATAPSGVAEQPAWQPSSPSAPADPLAIPAGLRTETNLPVVPAVAPPALPGLGEPGSAEKRACSGWMPRPAAGPPCAERSTALEALERALSERDEVKRHERLAGLESCAGLPPGIVRSLRAELAPITCGDVIVAAVLAKPPPGSGLAVLHMMTGQALAARLARQGSGKDQDRIEAIASAGRALIPPARARVATEASLARHRDFAAMEVLWRQAHSRPSEHWFPEKPGPPLMGEWNERLRRIHVTAEEAWNEIAPLGVLRDPRLDEMRKELDLLRATFPAGSPRGRSADDLLLPPLRVFQPSAVQERLVGMLPAFHATQLLAVEELTEVGALRAWMERGLPGEVRAALKGKTPEPEARRLLMHARIRVGARHWQASDFDEAIALAASWPGARPDDVNLLLAVALALRTTSPAGLRGETGIDVAGLDHVARSTSSAGPLAAYDAALLLALFPPSNADAAYWRSVADRFTAASSRLADVRTRANASEDASAAAEVASALERRQR